MDDHGALAPIVAFLREIGIEVRFAPISTKTVNPGLTIDRGALVVDEALLRNPGDLLHEAGHLAILTPAVRASSSDWVGKGGGEELAAMAWSYAAAVHLEIEPSVVFHANGYKGGSASLVENYTEGRYIGVPLLEWLEMCDRPGGALPYPRIRAWLNPTDRNPR